MIQILYLILLVFDIHNQISDYLCRCQGNNGQIQSYFALSNITLLTTELVQIPSEHKITLRGLFGTQWSKT